MTTTPRLGMTHIEGTDTIAGASAATAFQGKVNDAWNRIDDQIGAVVCTSSTRPSVPYAGQVIFETDTRFMYVRNSTNTAWTLVNTGIPIFADTASVSAPFTNMIIYSIAEGGLRRWTGGAWVLFSSNSRKIYKSVTQSVSNSSALVADNVFSWSLATSSAYALEGCLFYDGSGDNGTYGAGGTGGLKLAFAGPTTGGSSMFFSNGGVNQGNLTSYNVVAETLNATYAAARNLGTNGATVMSCRPSGILVVGSVATPSLLLMWTQGVSNATATRILGGSWLELTKIS